MLIEASGTYSPRLGEGVQTTIADMLRYDGGTILEVLKDEPIEGSRAYRKYTVLIDSKTYTPGRWASFSIKTKKVQGKGQR